MTLKKWGVGYQKRNRDGFVLMEVIAGLVLIGCFVCISMQWIAHIKKRAALIEQRIDLLQHIQDYLDTMSYKTFDESIFISDMKITGKKYTLQVPELAMHPVLNQPLKGFQLVQIEVEPVGMRRLNHSHKKYIRYLGLLHEKG